MLYCKQNSMSNNRQIEGSIHDKFSIESDNTEIKLNADYISKTKTKIILIKDKKSSSFFNDIIFTVRIDNESNINHIIQELSVHKSLFPAISNHYYSKGKFHLITNSINNSISIAKFFIEHIDEVNEKKIQRIIGQLVDMVSHVNSHKMKIMNLTLDDVFIDVDNDKITLVNILLITNANEEDIDVKMLSNVILDMIKMYIIYINDKSMNPPSFRRNKSVHIMNVFSNSNSVSKELNELMSILTNETLSIDDIVESEFMKNQIMKRKTMKEKKNSIANNNDVNIEELVSKFKESQLGVIDEDNNDELLLSKVISDCSKKQKKKKLISLDDSVDKKRKQKSMKKSNLFSNAILDSSQLINEEKERVESTPIKISFKPLDMVRVNSSSMQLLEAAMKERAKEVPKIILPEMNDCIMWERIKSIFG